MRKSIVSFLFIFFLVNILAFDFVDAYADVNIVIITPQEGKYQKFGDELLIGAKTAVDNINDASGVKGKRLNLISVDDQCDDILSVSTAQMMALNTSKEDKVSVVIGPYCSNSFEEVSKIYADAGILQIIPTTMGVSTYKQTQKGLVKMVGSKDRQGKDFFKFYQDNYSDKIAAIVYDSNDRDIVDISASIQSEFVKEGISDRLMYFDFNKYKSINKLSKEVIKSGARLAYILGEPESVAKAFRDIKTKNKNFVIFTNRYQISEEANEELGDLADDSYLIALPSLKDNPAFTEELVKLRLLGVEPEGLSVYSYSAIKLWEDLVNKSNSFEYNKLTKTLENNKFETNWGEVMFNNGAPKDNINYSIYKYHSGHYEQVY